MTDYFGIYLARWRLTPDGAPIFTHSSKLLPVRWKGQAAMLKVTESVEERAGALVMVAWAGHGAARVLAHGEDALLMERAEGIASLADLARSGADDTASRIICGVVEKLHAHQHGASWCSVVSLDHWFRELDPAAVRYGGVLSLAADTARYLLATSQEAVVLHGDIHHGNILDFGPRGWLAIDPKGLMGERGFDYANLFCNSDHEMATKPGRFLRQLDVVAQAAALPRVRLLQWVLAYAGLSAAWTLGDGNKPETALSVAELAAKELREIETGRKSSS
ncbi:3'-kinase [Dyella sp. M7H15-1]|uniref:aminoglycoside phosphotransferase family protein n=1 Tax=Dyella sp. M7H15-1 TaxID=2501295 RepID=UPI001004D743|nr:aminoglycoside phosphotransferase family protein [Dyella sp. M7H15-1]QAU23796.1 3'-kinase [Dyella sp. M7H15-1]